MRAPGRQLISSHHIAEREKHAGKQQHQKKQTDDVPPFQYAFSALDSC